MKGNFSEEVRKKEIDEITAGTSNPSSISGLMILSFTPLRQTNMEGKPGTMKIRRVAAALTLLNKTGTNHA